SMIVRHGRNVYADSEVATFEGDRTRRATYAETAARAEKLAAALKRLGIGEGDRVGTFCWNHQEHLEAYFAVPCMGAVLHTLNLRLPPHQLAQIINHAGDRVVIVDDSLVPLLAAVKPHLRTVEHFVVVGAGDAAALGDVHRYEDLLNAAATTFAWPELDERSAAAMCYTTGTTGDPKGVAYSHRSIYLHSLAVWGAFRIDDTERILTIVPMFHVNAWGIPYAAWMVGADQLMPARFLQPPVLCDFIQRERPSFTGGVPTILSGVLQYVLA